MFKRGFFCFSGGGFSRFFLWITDSAKAPAPLRGRLAGVGGRAGYVPGRARSLQERRNGRKR